MATFAELMTRYTLRVGIADAELARKIGVRRQTIFRWKEGLVQRPRDRDVVLDIAKALRLTPEERDGLLLAAGFAPETIPDAVDDADLPDEVVSAEPKLVLDKQLGNEAMGLEPNQLSSSLTPPTTESNKESSSDPSFGDHRKDGSSLPRKWSNTLLFWLLGISAVVLVTLGYMIFLRTDDGPAVGPSFTEAEPTQLAKGLATTTVEARVDNAQSYDCESSGDSALVVLVARFVPYGTKQFNVAGRIVEAMEEEARREELATLRIERIEKEIANKQQADLFMDGCSVAVLIWGEYDDGRVVAQITSVKESRIQFPADLATVFDVNVPAEVRILALEALGLLLLAEERFDESITAFERALTPQRNTLQDLPTQNQGYILNARLGRAYYNEAVQNGDRSSFKKAVAAYDEAIALAPHLQFREPWFLYNRGIAYLDLHRASPADDPELVYLDLAIDDLEAALRIKGTAWNPLPGYTMRGIAHMTRKSEGDFAAAIRDFSAAIDLDPKPDYYYNRALGHIAAHNIELWEVDLDKAIELGYPARSIFTARCYAYLRQLEAEKALDACEHAIEEPPKAADTAYVNYAIALAVTGDQEPSIQFLTEHIDWLNANPGYYQRLKGELADEWLAELKEGEQPFTDDVLRNLE